ncbi:MAG: hypothetical protein QOI06_1599 [Nocardioidaceae bacterium]|nr:hypothetical protein [Nocardioidaceae bacterium]
MTTELGAESGGPSPNRSGVVGLVLAAGSGSRLGRPKALVTGRGGITWLARAVQVLGEGGCLPVYVVIGAASDEVRAVVPEHVSLVVAEDWQEGMGASLRCGLGAIAACERRADAVVVMLVDTPEVTPHVVHRLVSQGDGASAQQGAGTGLGSALGRSTYQGEAGHPVLIGREHWAGVIQSAHGDHGARDYLKARPVHLVECGDIGSGADIDTPQGLSDWRAGASGHLPR